MTRLQQRIVPINMDFRATNFMEYPPTKDMDSEVEKSDEDEDDDGSDTKRRFEKIMKDLETNTLDLKDENTFAKFTAENKNESWWKSADRDENTLLHLIAKDIKSTVAERYLPLVNFLIDHGPDLLESRDGDEKTPLYIAVSTRRIRLIRAMCSRHRNINTALKIPCSRTENCIHAAIRQNLPPKITTFLIENAEADTLCAQDHEGKTPLHLAVEFERCISTQPQVVEALMKKCDLAMDKRTSYPKGYSPYRYHVYSRNEAKKARQVDDLHREKISIQSKRGESVTWEKNGQGWRGVGSGTVPSITPPSKPVIPTTDMKRQGDSLSAEDKSNNRASFQQIVKLDAPLRRSSNLNEPQGVAFGEGILGSADPMKTNSNMTSYSLSSHPTVFKLPERVNKTKKIGDEEPTEKSANIIRDFLKLHCMRTRNSDDTFDFLYGGNPGMFNF
jgi:hypothetical protein